MTKKERSLSDNVCEERIFSKIYEENATDLHDFIYYKYGAHFDPKDKTQEAFLTLWQKCKKIPPEKARSFLFTVANNLTLNEIKHQKVVLEYQKNEPSRSSTNHTPQFLLEEKQYLEKFQRALAELPEKQRIAFLLNRVEGKRHKEIADILNISRKAVEKRIYKALATLRKKIEKI
ncbi:RNA polymerase sigma factor [Altibacter sp. HG106]|uniref:RNA polymerase sigma factor n=1 Tax=Altibacter sp. HG106 TaxID=3023937 RepID=UPI002350D9E6|nr:sigma-70 family RNA polymerase sigma factor [Altibacter sp. HG106]MDC7996043.1 sigma-70 family RNA polymerase sigma factor [Altibacter sp. HG106]